MFLRMLRVFVMIAFVFTFLCGSTNYVFFFFYLLNREPVYLPPCLPACLPPSPPASLPPPCLLTCLLACLSLSQPVEQQYVKLLTAELPLMSNDSPRALTIPTAIMQVCVYVCIYHSVNVCVYVCMQAFI